MHPIPLSGDHRPAQALSDAVALGLTKLLRGIADTFFTRRYGHRAVVLETVAAVPGMVGAMLIHLRGLRRLDGGGADWVQEL
ncbi:MAG TPA: alternative oxidase, partial [Burkholderiaceae bacterium]|nr:alternative oxidase [Burkholderiaceae bacterium]